MASRRIHPEVPFTIEDWAAVIVLFGASAEEALNEAKELRSELSARDADSKDRNDEGGTWIVGPRVILLEQAAPVLHLLIDIHSGGTHLSSTARVAWKDLLEFQVASKEFDRIFAELEKLGPGWSSRRAEIRKLLCRGEGN